MSEPPRFDTRMRLALLLALPMVVVIVSDRAAYDRIAEQIRAQYVLGYVSTNPAADGRWRKVDIRVRRPGSGQLRVRTRNGYFAAYKP